MVSKCNADEATNSTVQDQVDKDRKYKCDVCQTILCSLENFIIHQKSEHAIDRPFSCEVCHKTFKSKQIKNNHQTVHSDERPFSCEVCQKSFKRKSDRNVHQKQVH